MFNFEKLNVWNEALAFADQVYAASRRFPDEERFGLANQIRRAAVSFSSNIAEGSSRNSSTNSARFVGMRCTPPLRNKVECSAVSANTSTFLTRLANEPL